MLNSITSLPSPSFPLSLTNHAATRMQQRGISSTAMQAVLDFGRRIHAKGLSFYVLGHKEVALYADRGVDLSNFEGLQVLVAADGAVVTTYRSRDLHAIKVQTRGRHCKRNQ
ncbi:MAG: hypothetical protein BWK72_20025 [Rhodoferax ferrireducens]|uniref:DUF4258 domain-containing protein n=1 Tax=Rhodoferax ferrireducens TaxID=192843 RepID=A0A1W9KP36_9BURK|nr:MAG: hypothetical protein BWK72_20025 [Rhodoferax ferrireducens]